VTSMYVVYHKKTGNFVSELRSLDEAAREASRLNALHHCREYSFCSRNTYYRDRDAGVRKGETTRYQHS